MAYNKRVAELKYLKMKKENEEIMRRELFDEANIIIINNFDKEQFNSNRRFYEHEYTNMEDYFTYQESMYNRKNETVSFSDILDDIGNMNLFNIAKSFDNISVFIIINLINGYSVKEIASMLGITPRAVNLRLQKIRRKILAMNESESINQ